MRRPMGAGSQVGGGRENVGVARWVMVPGCVLSLGCGCTPIIQVKAALPKYFLLFFLYTNVEKNKTQSQDMITHKMDGIQGLHLAGQLVFYKLHGL